MLKQKKTHAVACIVSVLLFTVTFGFLGPDSLQAADCVRIRANFKKLKGVVERKVFLEKAILECADDPEVTYYYAYNMERLRKYDRALQYYQKVIELDQNYAKAYMGMGDMYRERGQLDKAIDFYEKGLSLDPDNVWARRSLQKVRSLYQLKTKLPANAVSLQQPAQESFLPEKRITPVVQEVVDEPVKTVKVEKEKETHVENVKWEKATVQSEFLKGEDDVSTDDFIQSMVQKNTVEDESSIISKAPSINMPIQFAMNSGYLSDDAMSTLDTVICPALQSEELKEMRFEVIGHTDNSGDETVNMNISRLRAHTVKAYLVTRCNISPDRLEVSFQGPNEPIVPNTSRENRQRNRRVEFRRL
ncbi:MAG: OmpA family protein [Deltaproteobacteria bacterium]|nr:OmpA family protein [Deltaproteobacteria bacterium]